MSILITCTKINPGSPIIEAYDYLAPNHGAEKQALLDMIEVEGNIELLEENWPEDEEPEVTIAIDDVLYTVSFMYIDEPGWILPLQ